MANQLQDCDQVIAEFGLADCLIKIVTLNYINRPLCKIVMESIELYCVKLHS